jgi:periplasmic glucans biosynthesis protein
MLVEIPTGTEFMDNIVAFWRPEAALEAGGEHRFDYRLSWTLSAPAGGDVAILQSRSGREHHLAGTRRFVVDFAGDAEGLVPDLSAAGAGAEVSGVSLFALPEGRGTRATFLLTPGGAEAVELRLVLRDGAGRAASAVWLHRWTPARDGGV